VIGDQTLLLLPDYATIHKKTLHLAMGFAVVGGSHFDDDAVGQLVQNCKGFPVEMSLIASST
jgi:hypothetical protein